MPTFTKDIVITKPLLVRNTKNGPTTFYDAASARDIRWDGKGDHNGGDVSVVPLGLLENPDFLNALSKGIIEVIDGPEEVLEALAGHLQDSFLVRQAQASHNREEESRADIESHVFHSAARDTMGIPCIGPGPRGGECGVLSPVLSRNARDVPPLCSTHQHLAREFAPVEGEVDSDGKARISWVRAEVSTSRRF